MISGANMIERKNKSTSQALNTESWIPPPHLFPMLFWLTKPSLPPQKSYRADGQLLDSQGPLLQTLGHNPFKDEWSGSITSWQPSL